MIICRAAQAARAALTFRRSCVCSAALNFPPRGFTRAAPDQVFHGQASVNQDPLELQRGHRFYVTKKNARTMTEKLVMKKYDPVVRKHVEFREGKIK